VCVTPRIRINILRSSRLGVCRLSWVVLEIMSMFRSRHRIFLSARCLCRLSWVVLEIMWVVLEIMSSFISGPGNHVAVCRLSESEQTSHLSFSTLAVCFLSWVVLEIMSLFLKTITSILKPNLGKYVVILYYLRPIKVLFFINSSY
jgi:hypothetical protein